MKKRIVTAILMFCMAFSLCACGGGGSNNNSQDTEKQNTESSQKQEESESEESEIADGKIVYKVKVVDQNGDPVADASVQMCLDSCMWANTNAEGIAELKLEEAEGYKAEVLALPDGYTEVNEEPVYLESGATEVTLTVEKQ